jgi:phage terminase large subunit GpA-like protein
MNVAIDYQDGLPVTEVALLTAGVDIQKNRIEVEVLGWAKDHQKYSIDYNVIEGNTDDPEVWGKLAVYLEGDFLRPDGAMMNISYSCIDSGYLANIVYEFCERFGSSRCCPIKGSDTQRLIVGPAKATDYTKSGSKKAGTAMLRTLGVSILKEQIFSSLKLRIPKDGPLAGVVPTGYCWFPKDRSVYYFKGLCSEIFRIHQGREQWVKVVERNEPLDLRVYAYAAGQIVGVTRKENEWFDDQIAKFVPERKIYTATPVRERRKSDFWG